MKFLLEEQNQINEELLKSIKQLNETVKDLSESLESKDSVHKESYSLDFDKHNDGNTKGFKGTEVSTNALRDIKVTIYEKPISFSGSNIPLAQDIYYAQQLGMKLRYIHAELNGGQLVFDGDKYRTSAGNMKFGRIKLGFSDMIKGFIRKNNSESFFLPAISGVGTLQLKDTIKYLTMVSCTTSTKYILEQGIYAASAGQFNFGVHADTKLGSLAFSGKNMLQTTVEGQGILILELPVPPEELVILRVTPDRPVRVNEQEVIYRVGNIKRNKKLASGLFGSLASGTGFVEEYSGEGHIALAPSMNLMEIIREDLDISREDMETMQQNTNGSFLQKLGNLKNRISGDQEQE